MFCKQCGSDLGEDNNAAFCPHCGMRLSAPQQEAEEKDSVKIEKAGEYPKGEEAPKEADQKSQGIAAHAVRSEARKRKQNRTKKKRRAIFIGIGATLILAIAVIWIHDTSLYWTLKRDEKVTLLEKPWWGWLQDTYLEENLVVTAIDREGTGVYKYDGQEIIPPIYDSIEIDIEFARIIATTNNSISLFDYEGRMIKEVSGLSSPNAFFMEEEGKIGYTSENGFGGIMDLNGNDILREVTNFKDLQVIEGICRRLYQKGGVFGEKWGIVDETGTEIVPCQYDDIQEYCDGVAVVEKDGLEGVIDLEGNEILPCQYQYVDNYKNGWARARDQDGNMYFFDTQGNIVIDAKKGPWRQIYGCEGENYIKVGMDKEKIFFVRRDQYHSGNTVLPDEYQVVSYAGGDMFCIYMNEKYGIIDADGRLVVPCDYDDISWMEGCFLVSNESEETDSEYSPFKYGLLNASGEVILPMEYNVWCRGGKNKEDDYYVFTKESEEGEDTQIIVSLAGEILGEYDGDYETVSYKTKNGEETRAYINGDKIFAILGTDGQPWQQWNGRCESRKGEYGVLSLENGKKIVVSIRDCYQIAESEHAIWLYNDGFNVWNQEEGRHTLYSYSNQKLWDTNVELTSGGGSLYLRDVYNDRWLPFDLFPFSKSRYYFTLER